MQPAPSIPYSVAMSWMEAAISSVAVDSCSVTVDTSSTSEDMISITIRMDMNVPSV